MCGISGIISQDVQKVSVPVLQAMALSLAHRGPDGQAYWVNTSGQAGLSHRRLAIVDLSSAAAQPMHYANRYTIVYNGEIYNYVELKSSLVVKGYHFQSGSDTEVILAMYAAYGAKCLDYFDGMFSFAIWDEQEEILFCARDRFGEKPFYYALSDDGSTFIFGSEIKALHEAGISKEVNHKLLLQFLAHGYTSDPADPSVTFYTAVRKLPAAHYCRFSCLESTLDINRYWTLDKDSRRRITKTSAEEQLVDMLRTSVKMRLHSDVSVGSSLSGGVDSSSLAALVYELSHTEHFKTFTAVFPGFHKDEAKRATLMADRLAFDNFTVSPSAKGLADDFRKVMYHQEEPFNSASVYAQYKVFGLAKSHDTIVLLDGQGADETLAGYDKYLNWHLRAFFPEFTARFLRNREKKKLKRSTEINEEYKRKWAPGHGYAKPVVRSLNDLLFFDVSQAGLEELLRYADRNSMAHGREVRLPYLNHQLVSFVFSLPDNLKIYNGWTKWVLRKAMSSRIPQEIAWKKVKTAFEPPQKEWMLYPAMQTLIHDARKYLISHGILNDSVMAKKPAAHDAFVGDEYSWRYLTAYLFLSL